VGGLMLGVRGDLGPASNATEEAGKYRNLGGGAKDRRQGREAN